MDRLSNSILIAEDTTILTKMSATIIKGRSLLPVAFTQIGNNFVYLDGLHSAASAQHVRGCTIGQDRLLGMLVLNYALSV